MPSARRKVDRPERRIAMFIRSLEEGTAALLLDQFPPDQQALIHRECEELGEVDPAEAQDVAREFMSQRREFLQQIAMDDAPAPITSVAQRISGTGNQSEIGASIRDIPVEVVVDVLRDEYPQTIAFVVSQMLPQQAAQFVSHLPPPRRADILRRMAELDPVDPEATRELQSELQAKFSVEAARINGNASGWEALKAMLLAADQQQRSKLIESLPKDKSQLVARFVGEVAAPCESAAAAPSRSITCFDDLGRMDDGKLRRVIESADLEVAVLALTGANPQLADRVLAIVDPKVAMMLRRRMAITGTIRLRDIDDAQSRILQAARRADSIQAETPAVNASGVAVSV